MDERLLSWHYENEAKTKESCKELLFRLKKLHLDPVLEKLQGREGAKVSFEDIINAYDKIKDDYGKLAKGAEDVIAAVFFEYHRVRKLSLMLLSGPFLRTYYYSYHHHHQHFFVFRSHICTGILTSVSCHSFNMNKKERPVFTV